MTTPTGSPPWLRTQSITDYGGDANKTDYLGIGVVNPKTDVSAAQLLRHINDVSAIGRVSPFCRIEFETNDQETPAADPTVLSAIGMKFTYSGPGYAGGSPPTGYPTVTRIADGQVRVTFASSYTDEFGVSGNFEIGAHDASATTDQSVASNSSKVSATVVDVNSIAKATGIAPGIDHKVLLMVW